MERVDRASKGGYFRSSARRGGLRGVSSLRTRIRIGECARAAGIQQLSAERLFTKSGIYSASAQPSVVKLEFNQSGLRTDPTSVRSSLNS